MCMWRRTYAYAGKKHACYSVLGGLARMREQGGGAHLVANDGEELPVFVLRR
jgi:hypothetical protein